MSKKKPAEEALDDIDEIETQPCLTGDTPKWTTTAERKRLGKQLLAVYLARGVPEEEAISLTKVHPDLVSPKGRTPHHKSVVRWYQECTFSRVVTDNLEDLRTETRRRMEASINRWEAQRVSLAERLDVADDLDRISRLSQEMARCENLKFEYLKLLIKITHLDKVAPMERLDDAEIRGQLLQHVTSSIRSFAVDELDEWIDRLSDARERASTVYDGDDGEASTDELEDLGIA